MVWPIMVQFSVWLFGRELFEAQNLRRGGLFNRLESDGAVVECGRTARLPKIQRTEGTDNRVRNTLMHQRSILTPNHSSNAEYTRSFCAGGRFPILVPCEPPFFTILIAFVLPESSIAVAPQRSVSP